MITNIRGERNEPKCALKMHMMIFAHGPRFVIVKGRWYHTPVSTFCVKLT